MDTRQERLQAALETFKREELLASDDDIRKTLEEMLEKARDLEKRDLRHAAWGSLAVSRRLELFLMPRERLEQRATALANEADQKLRDWRKAAAKKLLIDVFNEEKGFAGLSERDLAARAWYVSYLLDGESDNRYYKQAVNSEATKPLLYMLIILVPAVTVALTAFELPTNANSLSMLPYVVLFGAMGACFSGLRSLLGPAKEAIPEVLLSSFALKLRPFIGATGAIVVFFAEAAGLINLSQEPQGMLVESFVAGFSEALLVRVLGAFDTDSES